MDSNDAHHAFYNHLLTTIVLQGSNIVLLLRNWPINRPMKTMAFTCAARTAQILQCTFHHLDIMLIIMMIGGDVRVMASNELAERLQVTGSHIEKHPPALARRLYS